MDFDPPLGTWRQARDRLVQMDREATSGLQRSEITIKEYRSPAGFGLVVFGACFFTYVLLCRRGNFEEGSWIREYLLDYVPPFRDFAAKVRPIVFYPMVGIHLLEAYTMAKTRLSKHTVPLFSGLWWKWTLSTFVEGVGAFMRFVLSCPNLLVFSVTHFLQVRWLGEGEEDRKIAAEALSIGLPLLVCTFSAATPFVRSVEFRWQSSRCSRFSSDSYQHV